ncbi:MAG: coproporphyrinogen III oxidase family protein [bacterium]|nr:coproporphyrinogen III oxidase family protein [bacterium]
MTSQEPQETKAESQAESKAPTRAGNYFVSNYPPYSVWSPDHVGSVRALLAQPASPRPELGLYVHVPFCRKRCDFCYFKVYTDKNGAEVRRYLDAVLAEAERYAQQPYLSGRKPRFVYIGGGTPSYLSTLQLRHLFEGLRAAFSWDDVEEVAFECEPGTLQEGKVKTLRDLGVTRVSLGVENFDPQILEWNNRAHRAVEIDRAYGFIRDAGFDAVNIDLIAGMIGETEQNWAACIERTIEMAPESVTIYQMEVPYNTTIYKRMKDGREEAAPVADWETKRRWVGEAFAKLEEHGYHVGSAYTAVRGDDVHFLYRDALWHGADLLGLGVSSFSHLGGIHVQNEHAFEPYTSRVEAGEIPLLRAHPLAETERLLREFILQMKLGELDAGYFRTKFGVEVSELFAEPLQRHAAEGWLSVDGDTIRASREGLLRIDELLHDYFLAEHRDLRYA